MLTFVLLAIPILIVIAIVKESGKDVMVDPLAETRRDEAIFQSVAHSVGPRLPEPSMRYFSDPAPLYCPGCKTYEDVTLFRGDEPGMKRAIETWYEEHKPHFQIPADNQTLGTGAPGG